MKKKPTTYIVFGDLLTPRETNLVIEGCAKLPQNWKRKKLFKLLKAAKKQAVKNKLNRILFEGTTEFWQNLRVATVLELEAHENATDGHVDPTVTIALSHVFTKCCRAISAIAYNGCCNVCGKQTDPSLLLVTGGTCAKSTCNTLSAKGK